MFEFPIFGRVNLQDLGWAAKSDMGMIRADIRRQHLIDFVSNTAGAITCQHIPEDHLA
jgi:hypothetical protein